MLEYNYKENEADLVGDLYYRLREEGVFPRLEVWLPSLITKSRRIRADLGVIKEGCLVAVVEAKRGKNLHGAKSAIGAARRYRESLQERAYESFERNTGVPVLWLRGRRDLQPVIIKIKELISV
jgi:hypothetical protein